MLYKDKFPPGTFYGFKGSQPRWVSLNNREVYFRNSGVTSADFDTGCPSEDLIPQAYLPPEFLTCQ